MQIVLSRAFHSGDEVTVNGQRFRYVGVVDYTRRDGVVRDMSQWLVHCAECDAPFETLAFEGYVPQTRRCPLHRQPGKKIRVKRDA